MLGPLYFVVLGVVLILLGFVAPPLLAARKGYSWYLWIFACGLIGLIVLAFLPYANKPDVSPEVNQTRQQVGNTVGAVLSVIGVLVTIADLIITFATLK